MDGQITLSSGVPLTARTTLTNVMGDPLLSSFSAFLFPKGTALRGKGLTLGNIPQLMPYHTAVTNATTIDVIGALLAERRAGRQPFHPIYSLQEQLADPGLSEAGVFHFAPMNPDGSVKDPTTAEPAPFAIICAGGGFQYVASIHESLPYALHLARRGYHGFALQYRLQWDQALEDVARAISWVFRHAAQLNVDVRGYSLWGASAGARLAATVGTYGPSAFGGSNVPRPAAVILQYSGHEDWTPNDPATFAVVGMRDPIAPWRTMRGRIDRLAASGVATEFHAYRTLGHGFGLGVGTDAEGWIDEAIDFWAENRALSPDASGVISR